MKRTDLKKNLLVIALAGVCIGAVTFVLLLFSARTYSIYMPESKDGYQNVTAEIGNPDVVEMISVEKKDEVWAVTFRAKQPGGTEVAAVFPHTSEDYGTLKDRHYSFLYVTRFGTILEPADLDFNGFYILCGALAAFFLFAGVYLFLMYRRRKRETFFSYDTVLNLGLSLFFLLHGAVFFGLVVFCLVNPGEALGRILFFAAQYALTAVVMLSLPFILLLSVVMAVSNVWLIRHEGLRRTNLLALILAALMMGGVLAAVVLAFVNTQMLSFEPNALWISVVRTVFSALFLYFLAMLFATQYCCVIAARRKPPLTQDYVLILGCAIRKDGTLYPLLKGRADRAAAFYRRQKEATGKAPVLVPSGGQGSDEVMAEGEAVRRYLLSLGIPETDVLAETQSANTQENMKCSKALIDERKPDASVIFSTTNYHVFRSGILANDAGLHADGIASKTKWYFWPNAQIREYVGLLVRSRKLHAVLLLLLVVFSLLFSNLGAIISALIS